MDDWNDYAVIALRLGLALMVGCILGLNRWVHNKAAGIRTHSLVSIGAAVIPPFLISIKSRGWYCSC